jgi:integrase/recombinase XerD
MEFKEYLQALHYETSTITIYQLFVKRLREYLSKESATAASCSYSNMLGFMRYMQQSGYSKFNINNHLAGLTQYFNYLKKTGQINHNPVKNLRIRNLTERLPHDILSKENLQKIYDSYQNESITGKRDKLMLGLLIYQGLLQGDLLRLEPQDVDLKQGTIYARRNTKTNARIMKLEPFQVLPMQEYIKECRPQIIAIRGEESPYLFIGKGSSRDIKNSLREMMKVVKKLNPELKNQMHIRTSVITHWVKEKNLREAQYLAGHYKVTSTERYKHVDLRGLQETLQKYHPLK